MHEKAEILGKGFSTNGGEDRRGFSVRWFGVFALFRPYHSTSPSVSDTLISLGDMIG